MVECEFDRAIIAPRRMLEAQSLTSPLHVQVFTGGITKDGKQIHVSLECHALMLLILVSFSVRRSSTSLKNSILSLNFYMSSYLMNALGVSFFDVIHLLFFRWNEVSQIYSSTLL